MKITATATVTYDTDEVLSELRRDYPEDSFDQEYAKTMIQAESDGRRAHTTQERKA